jgi:hypothetical protein
MNIGFSLPLIFLLTVAGSEENVVGCCHSLLQKQKFIKWMEMAS